VAFAAVGFAGVAGDAGGLPVAHVPECFFVAVMVNDVVDAFGEAIFADGTGAVFGPSKEGQRRGSPATIVAPLMR